MCFRTSHPSRPKTFHRAIPRRSSPRDGSTWKGTGVFSPSLFAGEPTCAPFLAPRFLPLFCSSRKIMKKKKGRGNRRSRDRGPDRGRKKKKTIHQSGSDAKLTEPTQAHTSPAPADPVPYFFSPLARLIHQKKNKTDAARRIRSSHTKRAKKSQESDPNNRAQPLSQRWPTNGPAVRKARGSWSSARAFLRAPLLERGPMKPRGSESGNASAPYFGKSTQRAWFRPSPLFLLWSRLVSFYFSYFHRLIYGVPFPDDSDPRFVIDFG